jgi:hypothetical protein
LRTLNQARDLTFVTMNCLDNSHDHRGHGPYSVTTQAPRARSSSKSPQPDRAHQRLEGHPEHPEHDLRRPPRSEVARSVTQSLHTPTLGGIAAKYELSVTDLVKWNGISNPDQISVDQKIELSGHEAAPGQGEDTVHTVVAGDTVSGLAERYGKRWIDIAVAKRSHG